MPFLSLGHIACSSTSGFGIQEQKEIESKEQRRREAFLPKGQPTPIPEEGAEIVAEERKVELVMSGHLNRF